jgi:MYXO-CTERM domain-containing protein
MTFHLPLRGSIALLFALGAFGASRTASADPTSCTQNSDCSKGFTCQAVGATACPGYACPAMTGTDVDAQACPPPPACDPQVILGCMPGPCSTDSDCATGMVCYADSYTTCPSPAPQPSCPKNADCAVPAVDAGACTTTTVKSCVPRYDVPCTVSSDCGDGFTCVPDTVTACSGGGSAGSGVSGGAPTTGSGPAILVDAGTITVGALDASSSPPPSCTTTTESTSSCQVNTIPCATSSDCPSTWACVAQPTAVSNICAGPASFDGAVPPCTPDPAPAQMLCEPPYEGLGVSPGGASLSAGGSAPVPALAQNAAATDAGSSGSSAAPTRATGGCQIVAPGAAPGAVSLFTLLGLTALARRRRSQPRS